MQPYGIGDELMTVCRDRQGCWGTVELMRDSADAPFEDDDVRLLHDLAPALGALLRRSAPADGPAMMPGTLVLDAELRPLSWTASLSRLGRGAAPARL